MAAAQGLKLKVYRVFFPSVYSFPLTSNARHPEPFQMPPRWQDRQNQQHQWAPEPASGATWETICHQLTATDKRSERSKAGLALTHADHHGRGRGIWWGGLLHRGVVLHRGGVVFSVSLDLDTKAGLGEVLMQNDNMYSENQVFFEHTLWLEPDQKKDTREDTV